MSVSSCRPQRLIDFEGVVGDMADGFGARADRLSEALEYYRQHCDVAYRERTVEADDMLRGLRDRLRDWGEWTGTVGRGFREAGGDGKVVEAPESVLVDWMRRHLDDGQLVFRGVPEGAAAALAGRLGFEYDQNDPPAWVRHLNRGGNAMDVASAVAAGIAGQALRLPRWGPVDGLRFDGRLVRIMQGGRQIATLPRATLEGQMRWPGSSASDLRVASRWASRAGLALAGTGAAADQWFADEGASGVARATRATTRGVSVAAGAGGGAYLGGLAGTACGPFMWACSPAGAFLGGLGGAALGDAFGEWAAARIPGGPPSFEERMAGDVDVVDELEWMVDTTAVGAAVAATEDEPPLRARLPLRPGGAEIIDPTDPPARGPDPWVRDRSYE